MEDRSCAPEKSGSWWLRCFACGSTATVALVAPAAAPSCRHARSRLPAFFESAFCDALRAGTGRTLHARDFGRGSNNLVQVGASSCLSVESSASRALMSEEHTCLPFGAHSPREERVITRTFQRHAGSDGGLWRRWDSPGVRIRRGVHEATKRGGMGKTRASNQTRVMCLGIPN